MHYSLNSEIFDKIYIKFQESRSWQKKVTACKVYNLRYCYFPNEYRKRNYSNNFEVKSYFSQNVLNGRNKYVNTFLLFWCWKKSVKNKVN